MTVWQECDDPAQDLAKAKSVWFKRYVEFVVDLTKIGVVVKSTEIMNDQALLRAHVSLHQRED